MTTKNAQYSGDQYRHGDSNPGTNPREAPSPLDLIRGYALSLRDLAEGIDATDATLTLASGAVLSWSADDGFHLLTDGETLDITEWVDHAGFVPVEGVESVRDQFVTLAQKRGAGV